MVSFEIVRGKSTLFRFLISFGIVVLAGMQLHVYLSWDPKDLARHGLLIDDAYFYSVLARNFLKYKILTLDGVMTTNGVQPLWMIGQIFLRMLFPNINGIKLLASSSWAIYVSFVFFTIWYINKNFSVATVHSTLTISGLILLQPYFQYSVMRGLETPLMLLILILTLIVTDRVSTNLKMKNKKINNWDIIVLALLASLLFFSRTDLFLVPIIIFIWLFFIQRHVTKQMFIFSSVVALIVIPYLSFNYLTEQSLMPISGRVKLFYMNMFFPNIETYLNSNEWHALYHIFDTLLGLIILPIHKLIRYFFVFLLLIITWLVLWRNRYSSFLPTSIKLMGIITFLHFIYMQFFYRELRPYTSYYFIPEVFFVVLVIAFGVKKSYLLSIREKKRSTKRTIFYFYKSTYILILLFSITLSIGAGIKHDLIPKQYWIERLKLAEDISEQIPKNEKVAAYWPGLFAQFCERQVVPLDGIIGSNEYFQKYIKTGKEIDYLLKEDVRYLAIYLPGDFDNLFSGKKLKFSDWNMLGVQRLWENKHYIIDIKSERLINSTGEGWYLLELGSEKVIN